MEEHILEMINSHILRIENTLKDNISEIRTDLKDLKESQIKLAEVIVKLGSVEDKYNVQIAVCKETRKQIDCLKDKCDNLEKRLIPIEKAFENYSYIKAKFVVGLGLALVTGIGAIIINIIKTTP